MIEEGIKGIRSAVGHMNKLKNRRRMFKRVDKINMIVSSWGCTALLTSQYPPAIERCSAELKALIYSQQVLSGINVFSFMPALLSEPKPFQPLSGVTGNKLTVI